MIGNARAMAATDIVQKETKVMDDLKRLIRDVPNFPKPGIIFKDITPLLGNPAGLALAVELLANPFRGQHVDVVAGAESRGFIFGNAQNMPTRFLHQLATRFHRAACRQQVIDNQNLLAGHNGVAVHFQRIVPIFKLIR